MPVASIDAPSPARPTPDPVRRLSTETLVRAFTAQAAQAADGECTNDRFALELLRRALAHDDALAWSAFTTQYRRLLLRVVRHHAGSLLADEDEDYWVDRTMERFWRAVGARGLDGFPSLAAVLQYLKLCARSVLLDELRARRLPRLTALEDAAAERTHMEPAVLGDLAARDLWQLVAAETRTDAERAVAYLSFVEGCQPREIYRRQRDRWRSVHDVYRVKHVLLERLRRNERIRALRQEPEGVRA
jgi:hypothetical protein